MISLTAYIAFFVFIIGACIGSFLNVVALRGLAGESIVFPASHCPKCNKELNWYTNIPIFSWLFLRGKCEFCKEPISPQYPIVEGLNALLYLVCFLSFGLTFKTLFMCILISLFLLISITDFKESVILDLHTYIIIVLGIVYSLFPSSTVDIIGSLIGIGAGFLLFEALARTGYIFAGTRAFGEGDTLIAMGIGAFFGWKGLLLITVLAVVVQAFMAIPVLLQKAIKAHDIKNACAYGMLLVSLAAVWLFRVFDLYEYFVLILCLLGIVMIALGWALRVILKDIRQKKEKGDYLYLPFGPALVIAAAGMIFFSSYITEIVKSIVGI